jgi:hypothetical protein
VSHTVEVGMKGMPEIHVERKECRGRRAQGADNVDPTGLDRLLYLWGGS